MHEPEIKRDRSRTDNLGCIALPPPPKLHLHYKTEEALWSLDLREREFHLHLDLDSRDALFCSCKQGRYSSISDYGDFWNARGCIKSAKLKEEKNLITFSISRARDRLRTGIRGNVYSFAGICLEDHVSQFGKSLRRKLLDSWSGSFFKTARK